MHRSLVVVGLLTWGFACSGGSGTPAASVVRPGADVQPGLEVLLTDSFLRQRVGISDEWVMPIMSLGQIAEIGTMAILGYALKSMGWRLTMFIGVLGHAARFAVFTWFPDQPDLIAAANLLHGICYAFFFATVYIFVDEFFPKDTRATAQGLFNFLILGAGPFVGNIVWPKVQAAHTTNEVTDFSKVFPVLAITAAAAAVFLLLFFRPPTQPNENP